LSASISSSDSSSPLSVSQLNREVRRLLEGRFDYLWVEGEISNLARPGSGHWYFTLKDDGAQVRCAMFRNRNQHLRSPPEHGQRVLVRARVSLYEARGEFQLIAEHMEDAGAGALQRAFEELKNRLAAEGLFDPAAKRALPEFPRRVAVVTSPTGAAIRDLISVFRRRFPALELVVLPVPVQGEGAASAICEALDLANRVTGFDAIVVGRGGGSLEDLWAFNEESVARAIARSEVPVVSAVGHETDFSIADFVADRRAPTPSAAAEILSPDRRELNDRLAGLRYAMARALAARVAFYGERLAGLRRHLRHPGERLREQSQRVDELDLRLRRGIVNALRGAARRAGTQTGRLRSRAPATRVQALRGHLDRLSRQLCRGAARDRKTRRDRLAGLAARLDSLSPLSTLERGYAVVTAADGRPITESSQVRTGATIRTRLARGSLLSEVRDIED